MSSEKDSGRKVRLVLFGKGESKAWREKMGVLGEWE
jgi:hypothetical protein